MTAGDQGCMAEVYSRLGWHWDTDPDQDRPRAYGPPEENPLVLTPPLPPDALDDALAAGIIRVYVRRYGVEALVQGIRAWPRIVEELARSGGMAAD